MTYSSDLKIWGDDSEIKDPTEMAVIAPGQSLQDTELIALDEITLEPFKSRSKLGLTAIMTALYVRP